MRKKMKWLAPLTLLFLILAVYLYPVPQITFDQLYAKVDSGTVESLRAFRDAHPPVQIEVNGELWEYSALGHGEETILFLHGMTGAYDIWWQQVTFSVG